MMIILKLKFKGRWNNIKMSKVTAPIGHRFQYLSKVQCFSYGEIILGNPFTSVNVKTANSVSLYFMIWWIKGGGRKSRLLAECEASGFIAGGGAQAPRNPCMFLWAPKNHLYRVD